MITLHVTYGPHDEARKVVNLVAELARTLVDSGCEFDPSTDISSGVAKPLILQTLSSLTTDEYGDVIGLPARLTLEYVPDGLSYIHETFPAPIWDPNGDLAASHPATLPAILDPEAD